MSSKSSQGRSWTAPLTVLALILMALLDCGLREKSELLSRGRRAVATGKVAQGRPIDSGPSVKTLPQREMPEQSDLQTLSESAPEPKDKAGYLSLTFDKLSQYEYPVSLEGTVGRLADGSAPRIPEEITALDQRKITLSGYMMPLTTENGKVTSFILIKNQLLCCYGQVPKINEYCLVDMDEPTRVHLDRPVSVSGLLQVGEVKEGDMLLCLYQISGENLEVMEY